MQNGIDLINKDFVISKTVSLTGRENSVRTFNYNSLAVTGHIWHYKYWPSPNAKCISTESRAAVSEKSL